MFDEHSPLISSSDQRRAVLPRGRSIQLFLVVTLCGVVGVLYLPRCVLGTRNSSKTTPPKGQDRLLGKQGKKMTDDPLAVPPDPKSRCQWVIEQFAEKDGPDPNGTLLGETYRAQSVDFNVFYRATANLFWKDFSNEWGNLPRLLLQQEIQLPGEIPLSPKSTWTWVTGDQHLSNFGAWRNRHGDVVFGVNDFDEAGIYDFHVDVLRIAVSICNHALTNGLDKHDTNSVLKAFTDTYIDTVLNYVGNEDALLFELTPKTSYGKLQHFLKKVETKNSAKKQLAEFTYIDETTGLRCFLKGDIGVAHNDTRLAALPPEMEAKIRAAFTSTHYGATMMKLGWNVRQWDDDYFTVLDVAGRIGSGIGSFGVARFYVLLKGTDGLLETTSDGTAVILDVKFEPLSAVQRILDVNDLAWYNAIFSNAASQVAQGQRRLTSYVDPFTGWIMIDDDNGTPQPFSVRQRSPWKDSFNLDTLTHPSDFRDFSAQIAIATATSHVRGSVAKAPADFKDVIHSIMSNKATRSGWGDVVERLAHAYHEQVLKDFACFKGYVDTKYGDQRAEDETS